MTASIPPFQDDAKPGNTVPEERVVTPGPRDSTGEPVGAGGADMMGSAKTAGGSAGAAGAEPGTGADVANTGVKSPPSTQPSGVIVPATQPAAK